jgi:hypothetical protein
MVRKIAGYLMLTITALLILAIMYVGMGNNLLILVGVIAASAVLTTLIMVGVNLTT